MQRQYFVAIGIMNRADLRSNFFFHLELILLDADCDKEGKIILPLRLLDSYSFNSHPIPYKKTFKEEPLAFFTQKVEPTFRFRGNFGEWRRGNIHDLCYGRGLTGRLFGINLMQFNHIKKSINKVLRLQTKFLSTADNLIDQEENYKNYSRTVFLKLIKEGVKPEEAARRTKKLKPLPEFNTFPLSGGANTCKVGALDLISSCYDKNSQKKILDYINYLKYGSLSDDYLFMFPRFLTSFIPRLTPDLDDIIFHCASDQWETRGGNSKYPYCDWSKVKPGEIFAVTAGSWYLDNDALMQPLLTPDENVMKIIKNLKAISRLCEINIAVELFKTWHEKINHYLLKLATCSKASQQHSWSVAANEYLGKLIASKEFKEAIHERVPVNLKPLLDAVYQHYEPVVSEELEDKPYYSW